jgi:hypothetical protein
MFFWHQCLFMEQLETTFKVITGIACALRNIAVGWPVYSFGRLCSWHMFLTVAYGRLSTVLNRTCGAQNCAANVVGSFTFNVRLTKCTDKHSM